MARLVAELNNKATADLAWLATAEELTRTAVVARALQVYRHVIEHQQDGGALLLEDGKTGATTRLLIV